MLRWLGSFALAALATMALAACGPRAAQMYGANASSEELHVRVVSGDGSHVDYLIPPKTTLRLDGPAHVSYAVLLDGHCEPQIVNAFGPPNNPFTYGGQLFENDHGGFGYTTDLPNPAPSAVATSDDKCSDTVTPPCDQSPGGACAAPGFTGRSSRPDRSSEVAKAQLGDPFGGLTGREVVSFRRELGKPRV